VSSDVTSLSPGTVFASRYRVVRCLGAGGQGAVYEVVDENTDSRRALKVLLPTVAQDADQRARFTREARVTGNIESDHIVRISDSGVDQATGSPFLVMELLRGEEIGKTLEKRGALDPSEAVTYLTQAALALDKTHAAGIVHRDLKPSNLFVSRRDDGSPCVKILDFGIAKVVVQNQAEKTRALGTPLYMAPEQIKGEKAIGPRSDIYALGHVTYAMLAGEPYWSEEAKDQDSLYSLLMNVMAGATEPPSARALRRTGARLPAAFDAWFFKATALRPEDRFERASAAVAALAEAVSPRAAIAQAVTGQAPAGAYGRDSYAAYATGSPDLAAAHAAHAHAAAHAAQTTGSQGHLYAAHAAQTTGPQGHLHAAHAAHATGPQVVQAQTAPVYGAYATGPQPGGYSAVGYPAPGQPGGYGAPPPPYGQAQGAAPQGARYSTPGAPLPQATPKGPPIALFAIGGAAVLGVIIIVALTLGGDSDSSQSGGVVVSEKPGLACGANAACFEINIPDPARVDARDILPAARKIAEKQDRLATLSTIVAAEVKDGAVNIGGGASLVYNFALPNATLAITVRGKTVVATRAAALPVAAALPDPRCSMKSAWKAALAEGFTPGASATLVYCEVPTFGVIWNISGTNEVAYIDGDTCALKRKNKW
jgi:hypothetical protein